MVETQPAPLYFRFKRWCVEKTPGDHRRRRPDCWHCPAASQLLRQRERYNTEFYCIEKVGGVGVKCGWLYCSKRAGEWNDWQEGGETREILVEPLTVEEQESWPLTLQANHTGVRYRTALTPRWLAEHGGFRWNVTFGLNGFWQKANPRWCEGDVRVRAAFWLASEWFQRVG